MRQFIIIIFCAISVFAIPFPASCETCTTVYGMPASTSQKTLKEYVAMRAQGDNLAAHRMVMANKIIILKGNIEAFITEGGVFSSTMKIRLKGQTKQLWTLKEAVQCR